MGSKYKYILCISFALCWIVLFYGCKQQKSNNKNSYRVESKIGFDSIQYTLIGEFNGEVDSVKVKNTTGQIENLSVHYRIDRSERGWSCRNQDKIHEFNRYYDSLANYTDIQERFLSKIIEIERLGKGDESQLVNYWKGISDRNIISSIDPEWDLIQRNYFENLVLNFDSSRTVLLNFDTCEKEEFLKFRLELEDPNNQNIYTSLKLRIGQETDVNSEVFFNPMYKKLSFSSDASGITNIKISRPLRFYR